MILAACYCGQYTSVRVLLAIGMDVQFRGEDNTFLLLYACHAAPDCIISNEQRLKLVADILNHSKEARDTVNWHTDNDNSPLFLCAYFNYITTARLLIAHGADLADKHQGLTLVQHARLRGHTAMAEFLERTAYDNKLVAIGEWRPRNAHCFPPSFRDAMRTLVVLGKAYDRVDGITRYPQACLDLLPEELLQHIFAYVTSVPNSDMWIEGREVARAKYWGIKCSIQ